MAILFFIIIIILIVYLVFQKKTKEKIQQEKDDVLKENNQLNSTIQTYQKKYHPLIDVDKTVEIAQKEKEQIVFDIGELRASYKEKRAVYEELIKEAAIYDETIEFAEWGVYAKHYDFDDPEDYKVRVDANRRSQKHLIQSGQAVVSTTSGFTYNDSLKLGTAFINRIIKLSTRAFNEECEAAIANTRWNNATRMEERIKKACTAINKITEPNFVKISNSFLNLKLAEFRLSYEREEKKQKIKEEQAAIRQQMREELKFEQEAEKAKLEEEKYQKLLAKAQSEVSKASGQKLTALEEKITILAEALRLAEEKNKRALSMAQQTRAGYVYVISNIGSFGKDVLKIGMTRRLEPFDRVKELGDASVPFAFDVHAMIYSEDAPKLENTLHKAFELEKINMVNTRREFFSVSLDEVEQMVQKYAENASFIRLAEAKEYHESLAIKKQLSEAEKNRVSKLPVEI